MKHFEAMRKWRKKIGIEIFDKWLIFPWSCHIYLSTHQVYFRLLKITVWCWLVTFSQVYIFANTTHWLNLQYGNFGPWASLTWANKLLLKKHFQNKRLLPNGQNLSKHKDVLVSQFYANKLANNNCKFIPIALFTHMTVVDPLNQHFKRKEQQF